jgi:hypothetical protein
MSAIKVEAEEIPEPDVEEKEEQKPKHINSTANDWNRTLY